MAIDSKEQVDNYLAQQSDLDVLRFITCGSVDDGKSTLIGRMLFEAQTLFEDQIDALKSDSAKSGTQGEDIDFALLVDGLSAEREQGITIDVAYRFFATDKRKFIVADTPGHEQYTRNMVTGASTAEVAVILVDARHGVQPQTKRHAFIASQLGIRHVALAINKMDLVDYDQNVYEKILSDFQDFSKDLGFGDITAIPLSALKGDNIITRSANTPWYHGSTMMGYLETVNALDTANYPFRFPVQWVNRPNLNFRGFSGTVASGQVSKGDQVRILPSGETAAVEDIILYHDSLDTAEMFQSVTLTLDREVDVSRGDVITQADEPCEVADQFDVNLVWMDTSESYVGRTYMMKIQNITLNATITDIKYKYNINTLEHLPAKSLAVNEIGVATIRVDRPIPFDAYKEIKLMGAFILIDKFSNGTVGAGMLNHSLRRASNIHHHSHEVNRFAREQLNAHPAQCLWFTGLSGSGKSTIADALEKRLHQRGIRTYILDGDNIRHGLNQDLGFTDADRVENIRRVTEVAKLMVDAGIVVICSFISPFAAERDMARSVFKEGDFKEIFVDVPLDEAEARDPKGLYKKARKGEIPNFTGINSPYETPENPDLTIKSGELSVEEAVDSILKIVN